MHSSLPFLVAVLALVLGCGDYPSGGAGNPGPRGCGDDLDCVGSRICEKGACVDPVGQPGDCIVASAAACGCEGKGFGDSLTYVAYRACHGDESAEITERGGTINVSWVSGPEVCSGEVAACEMAGLGRLLDQAFTGCPIFEPANPCNVTGAVAYLMVCRNVEGEQCSLLPLGLYACGEDELLAGIQEVRQRVRSDPEAICR